MLKLILVFCLFLPIAASAQEPQSITGFTNSTVTSSMTPNPWYSYEPKDDITAKELSKIVEVLLPALSCRHYFDDCGTVKRIDGLPPEIKRHFVRHDH